MFSQTYFTRKALLFHLIFGDGIVKEHGFDIKLVDFKKANGILSGYDTETQALAFEDDKFDIRWAVEHFDTKDLMPTKYKPVEGLGGPAHAVYLEYFRALGLEIIEKLRTSGASEELNNHAIILLDPEKMAWGHILGTRDEDGITTHEKYFAYQNASGEIFWFEVLEMNTDEFIEFRKEQAKLVFEK